MTRLQMQIVGGMVLMAAGVFAWSWMSKEIAESKLDKAEARVSVIEGRVMEVTAEKDKLETERDRLSNQNAELQRTANEWKSKAQSWKKPPPPPPVPTSDPELADSLVKLGFGDGLRIVPEGAGIMPRQDASLAYQWQGLARQLPSYQAQVETQAQAIQAGSVALVGAKTELAKCDEQKTNATKEADLQRDKARAESDAKDAIKKQLKAEKTQRWYWVAGSAIVTYLVHK